MVRKKAGVSRRVAKAVWLGGRVWVGLGQGVGIARGGFRRICLLGIARGGRGLWTEIDFCGCGGGNG